MSSSNNNPELVETADGTLTLRHAEHDETYHSRFGAVTESTEVFLHNSGVLKRLQSQQNTRVLEIGFGTGLNFIVTAKSASNYRCPLQYVAVENNLPPLSLISGILRQNLPEQTLLIEALESFIQKKSVDGAINFTYSEFITLNLQLENALLSQFKSMSFDAIYLDAFSSKNNPELWTPEYLRTLRPALKPGGILATYSVNRRFRDALQEAGFSWTKHKGPPGKREVITAWHSDTPD